MMDKGRGKDTEESKVLGHEHKTRNIRQETYHDYRYHNLNLHQARRKLKRASNQLINPPKNIIEKNTPIRISCQSFY